jgi:hypothetical protein
VLPRRGCERIPAGGAEDVPPDPWKGKLPVLTVIACVVLVTVGIVGAMKMENRLEPSDRRSRRPR